MRTRNTPRRPETSKSLELLLPATSANLGPAFDAAALALNLFLKVSFHRAREFSVEAKGRDRDVCGRAQNHLILTTYREVLEEANRPVQPMAVRITNEIPIGKGCGSSAAARLAGIAMAVDGGKLGLEEKENRGQGRPPRTSSRQCRSLLVGWIGDCSRLRWRRDRSYLRCSQRKVAVSAGNSRRESLDRKGACRAAEALFACRCGEQCTEFHASAGLVSGGPSGLAGFSFRGSVAPAIPRALMPFAPSLREALG